MAEERVVVYTAHQDRDADILIMQLSRAGIEAAKDPGPESDQATHWPVSVSGRDEHPAREVVGRFEQDRPGVAMATLGQATLGQATLGQGTLGQGTLGQATLGQGDSIIEVAAAWPRCPQCDIRRTTRCPICPASGTDFDLVEPEFAGTLGLPGDRCDATVGRSSSCSCGPRPQSDVPQSDQVEAAEPPNPKTGPPRMALMCHTCDEPFVPEFLRCCEWCGHEFADGYTAEDIVEGEAIPVQAMIVILGLLTLLLITCAYFAWLV